MLLLLLSEFYWKAWNNFFYLFTAMLSCGLPAKQNESLKIDVKVGHPSESDVNPEARKLPINMAYSKRTLIVLK